MNPALRLELPVWAVSPPRLGRVRLCRVLAVSAQAGPLRLSRALAFTPATLRLHHLQERGGPDRPDAGGRAGLSDDIVVVDSAAPPTGRRPLAAAAGRARHRDTLSRDTARRSASPRSLCRHPWLLNIDADEVIPPDLAAEIRALCCHGRSRRRTPTASASPRSFPARARRTASPMRWPRSGSTGATRGATTPRTVQDRVDLVPGATGGAS